MGNLVSSSGVEGPRGGVDHPPPSSVEVKERVELYLYSLFGKIYQNFRPAVGPSKPRLQWGLGPFTLLYFILLYFTLLYFTLLYFTLLYFTLLYFTLLYFTLLYFTLLYFTLLYFTLLREVRCEIFDWIYLTQDSNWTSMVCFCFVVVNSVKIWTRLPASWCRWNQHIVFIWWVKSATYSAIARRIYGVWGFIMQRRRKEFLSTRLWKEICCKERWF